MASHYTALGVDRTVCDADLRDAYKAKARLHHPDRTREASDASFIAVQTAYEILANPESRARYDKMLDSVSGSVQSVPSPKGPTSVAPSKASLESTRSVAVWVETDLGGMGYEGDAYTYTCRCGDYFELFDEDVQSGVHYLPCGGCSLKIKVVVP